MKVNIKKIKEITGFSAATISNAINYKKGVNPETAEVIRRTAKELGYLEESRITKIKFVTFKREGTIVEDTPFFPAMITGAEQECRENGMELVMCNLDQRDSNYEEEKQKLLNDLSSGIILLGTEMMDEDIGLIRAIQAPYIVIDYWKEDMSFNALLINNNDSARVAVEYLVSKGHTEIGYLRGKQRIKPFRTRSAGYAMGMSKASLPIKKEYQVTVNANTNGAYHDMKEYLAGNPKLPTAFFVDNDIIALGAMKAMWECGIRVPDDVSMIGFDDVTFASVSTPPLTTLRVPKHEMGRLAVRRLLEIVNDKRVKLKTVVSTEFIERKSVKEIRPEKAETK